MKRSGLLAVLALAVACASAPPPRRVATRPAVPVPTPSPSPPPTLSPEPTPTPTPTSVTTAVPTATATPIPVPTAPPPAVLPTSDLDRPLVLVLVERRSSRVRLPQPGRPFRASWDGGSTWLWGPLEVGVERGQEWQVGAFSDPDTAAAQADRLRQALGAAAEVRTATTPQGLVRVRVRWNGPAPADPAQELERLGFAGVIAVAGPGGVAIAAGNGGPLRVEGELLLEPAGEYPTAVGARSYRGRFRVRAAGDQVLVVNELNLESYLKGVVPAEMGPAVFPELEALKAQAVAARTYAVAHLGEHAAEGYDLCGTSACQAYEGTGAEHPLASRAVDETAGLVAVYQDEPIDAMYTSTCGGHTEDAALLFPDRAAPYLKGVPCAWERPLELVGTGTAGTWHTASEAAEEIALAVLGLEPSAAAPQAVVDRVGALCGSLPPLLSLPASADSFAAALLSAASLDQAAQVLAGEPSPSEALVGLADLFGVELGPPPVDWDHGWHLRAALATLELQGAVTRDRGEAVPRPDGVGIFPRKAAASEPLPSPLPLWERSGQALRPVSKAELLPGTTVERLRRGSDVVALVVARSGGDGEADRRSAWRSWVRERSWDELAVMLGVGDLADLVVTARSPSGRVVGLAAVGRSGSRKELAGFPIRRALDLPENLFTFHRLRRSDGTLAVRFLGRGWGHGVGLCQNGAFGLARAGMRFEQILATYYSGATVALWDPDSRSQSGR